MLFFFNNRRGQGEYCSIFPGRITSLGAAKFGLYETKNNNENKFLTALNFK